METQGESVKLNNIEVLASGLQMAVREMFVLPEQVQKEIQEATSGQEPRQTYEMWLNRLRLEYDSGLQNDIVQALCSADTEAIATVQERAHISAQNRHFARVARLAIKDYIRADIRKMRGSNSTMGQRQINRLITS